MRWPCRQGWVQKDAAIMSRSRNGTHFHQTSSRRSASFLFTAVHGLSERRLIICRAPYTRNRFSAGAGAKRSIRQAPPLHKTQHPGPDTPLFTETHTPVRRTHGNGADHAPQQGVFPMLHGAIGVKPTEARLQCQRAKTYITAPNISSAGFLPPNLGRAAAAGHGTACPNPPVQKAHSTRAASQSWFGKQALRTAQSDDDSAEGGRGYWPGPPALPVPARKTFTGHSAPLFCWPQSRGHHLFFDPCKINRCG